VVGLSRQLRRDLDSSAAKAFLGEDAMRFFGKFMIAVALMFGLSFPAGAEKNVLVLLSRTLAPYQEALKGFEQDGRFPTRVVNLEGDPAKVGLVQDALDSGKAEALLVVGTDAVHAIKNSAPGLPLVFTMVLEPVDLPGKKIGGVVMQVQSADQFSRIAKMLPAVKRIGVLYNPGSSKKAIGQAREDVGRFGMTLIPIAVENPSEVPSALGNLTKDKVDAIWSVVDNIVAQPAVIGQTIAHAQAQKLPFIGLSAFHVKAGALLAFSADFHDIGKQTAELTAKVISGAGVGKVEFPRKIMVYANEGVQKQLGLNLSSAEDVQWMR
jgi:putative ABC transport system substrate-binding protein